MSAHLHPLGWYISCRQNGALRNPSPRPCRYSFLPRWNHRLDLGPSNRGFSQNGTRGKEIVVRPGPPVSVPDLSTQWRHPLFLGQPFHRCHCCLSLLHRNFCPFFCFRRSAHPPEIPGHGPLLHRRCPDLFRKPGLGRTTLPPG